MTDEQYSKVDKELRDLLAQINDLRWTISNMVPETASEKSEWKPGAV